MAEPTTILGLLSVLGGLLISNIGMWIREWRKHQSWKRNNGSIEVIKTTATETQEQVKRLDGKMGQAREDIREVKTAVTAQKEHCQVTVNQMTKAIADTNSKVFELAKEKNK